MLLNKKELAKELGISMSTLNRLLAKGMPKIKLDLAVRFEYDEVIKWLKERNNA